MKQSQVWARPEAWITKRNVTKFSTFSMILTCFADILQGIPLNMQGIYHESAKSMQTGPSWSIAGRQTDVFPPNPHKGTSPSLPARSVTWWATPQVVICCPNSSMTYFNNGLSKSKKLWGVRRGSLLVMILRWSAINQDCCKIDNNMLQISTCKRNKALDSFGVRTGSEGDKKVKAKWLIRRRTYQR